ncbi:FMN-dependent NADH-azoreductase [Gluconacetobacter asukensis]|uniref:FMN dependent NADH:quinone oxidoreductase n=1 Tax=Gluconacetobacter asukensis TaxID=1017181 RepID=A0A7W4P164_9PROT|nr:FMN-dependent NADH-azoreductase [Gluconacetobacter asukensis]MBB2173816.1 FMN-dependent NADH-azoreductase [Gluconacetobacter asukensis]
MKQILMIEISPRGQDSASRAVAEALGTRLGALYPSAKLVRRDLAREHLPHLDGATLQAISTPDPAKAGQSEEAARLSDHLTDELLASDLLVIATPMWNFGIPSALKAWIDLVVRPGRTFQYAENGVLGLAKGTRAILIISSGGVFTDGPWRPWDYVEPYLRQVLGFIGITDVQAVRVEGMNIPALSSGAVSKAKETLEDLAL